MSEPLMPTPEPKKKRKKRRFKFPRGWYQDLLNRAAMFSRRALHFQERAMLCLRAATRHIEEEASLTREAFGKQLQLELERFNEMSAEELLELAAKRDVAHADGLRKEDED